MKRALIQFYKDLAPGYSFSGTPLQHLRGTITPNGLHFEEYHGGRPDLDPARHTLMIHGLVERPLKFDLDALERYPMVTGTHIVECSGNSFFNALMPEPVQAGCDMLHGLVSNTEWTGIPLSVLLDEAGVTPEARWIVATGMMRRASPGRSRWPKRSRTVCSRSIRTASGSAPSRAIRCSCCCRASKAT